MAHGDTARRYHRLSSYRYEPGVLDLPPADHPLVLQDFVTNDRPTFPSPTKTYPAEVPTVVLPETWPTPEAPALATLAGATGPLRPLDLAALARILHLSAGVVRVATRRDGRSFRFRPPGSAGGLFPLEVYVASRAVAGLDDGVWWYDPVGHALRRVGPAPAAGDATTLVVTGIPWRTGWRYAERGYRHLCWDAGAMLAHPLSLAASAGAAPRLWTTFPDVEVARLVGADLVQELPLAIVTLGPGTPAIVPGGAATAGSIDVAPVAFPLVTAVHAAGEVPTLGEAWPNPSPAIVDGPRDGIDAVILRRGSSRTFDHDASLTRTRLEACLAVGLRGSAVPHWVAVSAVDGVEPGLYRWPDLDRPLRTGDLRSELWIVCWEQDLCRDAAAVVISAADLDALDDRGYRAAQIDAGIASGRMQLTATALGFGASGMTFVDSEIEALLGEPLAGLLLTCLGVPLRPTRPAGTPRHPTDVS